MQASGVLPKQLDLDPETVEQGLGQLVLTIVELVRQLMEKQALRRMESGALSESDIERLGETLMKLDAKIDDLCKTFGIERKDLNISLGDLGELL
ncbi:MAG: hypothetical protein HY22_03000 [[Candidatus Thermochlorobacteriaceae] bacterium GBChlB]|nr:MAG: hypothetical protein HY22_03000 [[Candidatus Thermochlorobacteriaceae] bacterium GBChlB]